MISGDGAVTGATALPSSIVFKGELADVPELDEAARVVIRCRRRQRHFALGSPASHHLVAAEGEAVEMRQDERLEREWLARELHDTVAAHLTEMLVEMELLRRTGGPPELGDWQGVIRSVIVDIRCVLQSLRDQEFSLEEIQGRLQRKVENALAGAQPRALAPPVCGASPVRPSACR